MNQDFIRLQKKERIKMISLNIKNIKLLNKIRNSLKFLEVDEQGLHYKGGIYSFVDNELSDLRKEGTDWINLSEEYLQLFSVLERFARLKINEHCNHEHYEKHITFRENYGNKNTYITPILPTIDSDDVEEIFYQLGKELNNKKAYENIFDHYLKEKGKIPLNYKTLNNNELFFDYVSKLDAPPLSFTSEIRELGELLSVIHVFTGTVNKYIKCYENYTNNELKTLIKVERVKHENLIVSK